MPPVSPSIQAFFQFSSPSRRSDLTTSCTSMESPHQLGEDCQPVERTSSAPRWVPPAEYTSMNIASIFPGPQRVKVTGRIANFFEQPLASKVPQSAKGCLKMIIKDDTGAMAVRLWYASVCFELLLGQLVSIWTPHVSSGTEKLAPSSTPLFVSMFPERDRTCFFEIQNSIESICLCRTPLEYKKGKALDKLMTLDIFLQGGHEIHGARLITCVKSIGAKKRVNTRNGTSSELVSIVVMDDTAEATLTLWRASIHSVNHWLPSSTILLLTNPTLTTRTKGLPVLSLSSNTHLDVDPDILDAEWLRKFARRLSQRQHVNPPLPEGVYDVEATLSSPLRILYNLADVDCVTRANQDSPLTGFLSVVILEIPLYTLYSRNMLLCEEHCGVPIFANAVIEKCKQCNADVSLRVNPKAVSIVVDETGCVAGGNLVWSEIAWEQLLGRSKDELVRCSGELIKYLEQRLRWLRVTLVFGAGQEEKTGGRISVLEVLHDISNCNVTWNAIDMATVGSLRTFLTGARNSLRSAVAQNQRVSLVIGNESADLDSIISSILYAYLRTCSSPQSAFSSQYVPLINIPADDISIRPELLAVLPHANLEPSHLFTLDDLPSLSTIWDQLSPRTTQWVLVDHNALEGKLGEIYRDRVVGCIDHHKDENFIPKKSFDEPRIIETSGSCTSLIVNYFRDAWQSLSAVASRSSAARSQQDDDLVADDAAVRCTWDAQIAKLALASILIDTQALKDKDKTTEHDIRAVEFLEMKVYQAPQIGRYNREEYFQMISDAKSNLDSLDVNGILRKDYKQWSENGKSLGMSTIVKPLPYLIKRAKGGSFKQTLLNFARQREISLLAIMTVSTSRSGDFQRELLLLQVKPDAEDILWNFERAVGHELQLSSWSEEGLGEADDDMKIWWQRDVSKSRKQVGPLIRDIMSGRL